MTRPLRRQAGKGAATGMLLFALTACTGGSAGSTTGSNSPSASSSSSHSATSGPTQASAAAAVEGDFCRLLSNGEAQAALGKPVKAGVSTRSDTPFGPGGGCIYRAKDISSSSISLVNVILFGDKIPRSVFDQQALAKLGSTAHLVAGLGEVARFVGGPGGGLVVVFDHGRWLTVQVVNATKTSGVTQLTQLTRTALGRI